MHIQHFVIAALAACCTACGLLETAPSGFRLPAPVTMANAREPRITNPEEAISRVAIIEAMANKRALFIGEIHDNVDHHQNQLQLIEGLYARHPDMAIGMEYFQRPFQPYLDDYIAGRIDEKEMLRKTEYYKRWKIDFRMLRPIFRFAREKHIPLLALNVPEELHNKVFKHGMDSLIPQERTQIPAQIKPANTNYQERLKTIFNSHPQATTFQYFVDGVLLWDESMAETAANYLTQHPQSRMVILSGLVHVMYGDGIPERLDHRLGGAQSLITLNGESFGQFASIADFALTTEARELPAPGKLGITLIDDVNSMHVSDFAPASPALAAGIKLGDRIVSLDGIEVSNISELKTVMLDKQPSQQITVSVVREITRGKNQTLQFEIQLR
jgi:uncharacterized iron-regulated protein